MAAPQQHFEYTSAGTSIEMDQDFSLRQRMEEAKALYPGSKNWAKDEERLFEILYLRQDLPMLPSHWNLDFRGFPIPEHIFDTSDEYIPIVYAHSSQGSAEFAGELPLFYPTSLFPGWAM